MICLQVQQVPLNTRSIMNKSLITLAVATLFSVTALATTQVPGQSTRAAGSGHTGSAVLSGSAATSSSSGAGSSSLSFASNKQTATSTLELTGTRSASASPAGRSLSGTAGLAGTVTTSGESTAFNVSTGDATGAATAGGLSAAKSAGAVGFSVERRPAHVAGGVAGVAEATNAGGVIAGKNESAFAAGVSGATIEANAAASADWCKTRRCGSATTATEASTDVLATSYSDRVTEAGFVAGTTAGQAGVLVNGTSTGAALAGAKALTNAKVSNSNLPTAR